MCLPGRIWNLDDASNAQENQDHNLTVQAQILSVQKRCTGTTVCTEVVCCKHVWTNICQHRQTPQLSSMYFDIYLFYGYKYCICIYAFLKNVSVCVYI